MRVDIDLFSYLVFAVGETDFCFIGDDVLDFIEFTHPVQYVVRAG